MIIQMSVFCVHTYVSKPGFHMHIEAQTRSTSDLPVSVKFRFLTIQYIISYNINMHNYAKDHLVYTS